VNCLQFEALWCLMLHILISIVCKAAEPATKLYNLMYHQLGAVLE